MREAPRVHMVLSSSWNGRLACAPELLRKPHGHAKGHVDAAAGGAFLSLTINEATALTKKMVANQSWGEGRKTQKGSQSAKEADVLATKIYLLLQRMDGQVANPNMGTVQVVNSHTSYEVCGDDGHSGNNCPKTQEEAAYVNNGFRPP